MTGQVNGLRWMHPIARGILVAMVATAPAWGQEAAAPAAAPVAEAEVVVVDTSVVIDPDAQAILDRMTASLNSLQKFSVSAQISRDEMLRFGYKLQNNESARMWVERPNRLRMENAGDIKKRTFVFDGNQLTKYVGEHNVYSTMALPGTIGELVEHFLLQGVEMPMIDFLYHGYAGSITDAVKVGILVGDSTIGGVPVHHLAFRQPEVDWQLWVEKGERALPVRLAITTRYEVGDPQYEATLTWDTKPRFDSKTFKFTPPTGATLVPNLTEKTVEGGAK